MSLGIIFRLTLLSRWHKDIKRMPGAFDIQIY